MPKIKVLPPELVAKTAAGEVIENPASVVKELIENSLDAGARNIKVSVKDGGKKRILVVDDGAGMPKEDLLVCWKAHTSGKVFTELDLDKVLTYGFRGEALNSIACVSDLIIRSSSRDSPEDLQGQGVGWELPISFGSAEEVRPAGVPLGTLVQVDNLFSNFPARKKFLRSASVEFRKILDVFVVFVLAYPDVAFSLAHNGKSIMTVSSYHNRAHRMELVLGQTVGFIDFNTARDHMALEGSLCLPQDSAPSYSDLYFYVNKRYVPLTGVYQRIKKAYGTLLEKTQYPMGVLFLSIPPELVDVNVHPRKEEVRFSNEELVLDFIESSVRDALEAHNLVYTYPAQSTFFNDFYTVLRDSVSPWNLENVSAEDLCPEILQVDKTYLVASFQNEILIFDQHAAHEKILYSEIMQYLRKGVFDEAFVLAEPVEVLLSAQNSTLDLGFLEEWGFRFDWLENSLEIREVPAAFKDMDLPNLALQLLALERAGLSPHQSGNIENVVSTLACRSAVKAGDYLDPEERVRLIKKLLSIELEQYTCPHGRPTMVSFSVRELESLFKRK